MHWTVLPAGQGGQRLVRLPRPGAGRGGNSRFGRRLTIVLVLFAIIILSSFTFLSSKVSSNNSSPSLATSPDAAVSPEGSSSLLRGTDEARSLTSSEVALAVETENKEKGTTQNVLSLQSDGGSSQYDETSIAVVSESEAKEALRRFGALFANVGVWEALDLKRCSIIRVGVEWGEHAVCGNLIESDPTGNCMVISYGIGHDYSFDVRIQNMTGCLVVAMDPTVSYGEYLAPRVRFFKWAAPGIADGPDWTVVPLTRVSNELKMPGVRIPLVKMDCEGCEYKIFQDVAKNDPMFFTRVDQMALEVHLSRSWITNDDYALDFGRLIALMERSGLRPMHGGIGSCAAFDEARGCPDILKEVGYPCGPSKMCQNFLFARA